VPSDDKTIDSREDVRETSVPLWLLASEEDFNSIDLEKPTQGCVSAHGYKLSAQYRKAAEEETHNQAAVRVYSMFAVIMDFNFNPSNPSETFGAKLITPTGRTPIPEDFRGGPTVILHAALNKLTNPVLRARIADTCWIIDRSLSDAAYAAIAAYVTIVRQVKDNKLEFHSDQNSALGYDSAEHLRRALQIGRKIGWDKEVTQSAKELLAELRQLAVREGIATGVRMLSELDLDFGITDPDIVARDIEAIISESKKPSDDLHHNNMLWKLAARGFRYAKMKEDENRCRAEGAECLVKLAESNAASPMLASHWLSVAISEYQGVSGKRERRTELRHKLIDVQAGISEEMRTFSQEMDLSEIAETTREEMKNRSLITKLGIFASLSKSPEPRQLRDAAIEQIREYPLSSLFSTSYHDHEGKVIYRSSGAGGHSDQTDDAIQSRIAQNEGIRRNFVSSGSIEVARRAITMGHLLTEDDLLIICQNSPFIPDRHQFTYVRGFAKFFQGDMISALYILVPQLENSLRYVLKNNGHDVTKINSSDMTQEDRTISSLYEQMRSEMENIMGEAIVADIERVFLHKVGPSVRHQVAHGLLHDASPFSPDAIYACWLMFHLCCLPLFPYWDEIDELHATMFSRK
jgi:hypothetical protein